MPLPYSRRYHPPLPYTRISTTLPPPSPILPKPRDAFPRTTRLIAATFYASPLSNLAPHSRGQFGHDWKQRSAFHFSKCSPPPTLGPIARHKRPPSTNYIGVPIDSSRFYSPFSLLLCGHQFLLLCFLYLAYLMCTAYFLSNAWHLNAPYFTCIR